MAKQGIDVAGVMFDNNAPTRVTFAEMFSWVIWQFPRPLKDGLCGAVRPPDGVLGWYPAVVFPDDEAVQVYAHVSEVFDTPEAAADFLSRGQKPND